MTTGSSSIVTFYPGCNSCSPPPVPLVGGAGPRSRSLTGGQQEPGMLGMGEGGWASRFGLLIPAVPRTMVSLMSDSIFRGRSLGCGDKH